MCGKFHSEQNGTIWLLFRLANDVFACFFGGDRTGLQSTISGCLATGGPN